MARAIRKKSGTAVETNWHFVWSCSEIDKMITRTDPMIVKKNILLLLFSLFIMCSCHDSYSEIGDNYIYMNSIIFEQNEETKALEIAVPAQVLNYMFDDDYIIAYQIPDRQIFNDYLEYRPKNIIDSLERQYGKMCEIHDCYWIVRIKDKRVFGPMTKKDFEGKCRDMRVKIKFDPRYEHKYIGSEARL